MTAPIVGQREHALVRQVVSDRDGEAAGKNRLLQIGRDRIAFVGAR